MNDYEKYSRLIGKNLAYFRKEKYLTQMGLAQEANVSRTYIANIEAEYMYQLPSLELLFKLCEILDIQTYQLFLKLENEKF